MKPGWFVTTTLPPVRRQHVSGYRDDRWAGAAPL